jgi:hypothetical protein
MLDANRRKYARGKRNKRAVDIALLDIPRNCWISL